MTRSDTLAVLFPGQGSQEAGMQDTVARHRPDLVDLAADAVGEDPLARVGEGTRFDQPAIYCASLAGFERLGRPTGLLYAGHSLGEIAALAAAGALSDSDGLRLVAERGRLMQHAAERADGGMLALRSDRPGGEEIARRSGLVLANDNGPGQVVLSGPDVGLECAQRDAKEQGLLAKRLPVAGPFHSPAMEPVLDEFRSALADVELRPARVPVLSCVTAAPFDDVRAELAQALVSPVRWLETMRALQAAGAAGFVETGPGKVLAGLVRRALEGAELLGADDLAAASAVPARA